MSYTRVNWNSTTTYVSAENLNVMDKGIKDLDTSLGDVATLKTTAKTVVPAINEINNNLVEQPFEVLPSGSNVIVNNYNKKIGKLVLLNFSIKVTTSTTGWVNIGLIPQGFRPSIAGQFPCIQDSSTNFYPIYYGVDGTLNIYTPSVLTNINIVVSIPYFA